MKQKNVQKDNVNGTGNLVVEKNRGEQKRWHLCVSHGSALLVCTVICVTCHGGGKDLCGVNSSVSENDR
mgnify:CR=1 FL=1